MKKENTILCIMGRKESGKSTLTREIMLEHPRVFVLDTNGEYGEEDGFLVAHTFEEGARMMPRFAKKDEFRISLRDKKPARMVHLIDVAYEIPEHMIVIEETHFYCSPAFLPDEMSQLVRQGRHRAISQIYVSQRPAGLNRNLTSQADFLVSFKQVEARDIKWFTEGMPRDEARQLAHELKNIPEYKVKLWVRTNKPEKLPLPVLARVHEPEKKSLTLFEKPAKAS